MPTFKVTRTRRYVALVEADNSGLVLRVARDLPGSDWQVIEDVVDGDVYGIDGACQHLENPKSFTVKNPPPFKVTATASGRK